ncbi:hypothetical protein PVA44_07645 (plasmid) [Entomospira nematocerorum]|uniref:Virion morphogenesis protein n=1 Tax=Entomospira nematocerorum TaxID=2719987 RepID=A0A968GGF2_9SPIO|nr:hypothetical protein [Entomospira nematocera]NIZ47785.1 hypothetical protein [Entomospira nematocera]WDI34763.1 hypothetical protein PVA44_07645 [Entomospira nematocera]
MIKVTVPQMIEKHRQWIKSQPKLWSIIMNQQGDKIDKKRRQILENHLQFRSAHTKRYIMGDKGALYYYPTRIKELKSMKVVIGYKKNKNNLKAWDLGGVLAKQEKKMDYTVQGRGGSWRKLPITSAKIRGGRRPPNVGRGSDRVRKMHQYMRQGIAFYMPSQHVDGQKKRSGIYIKRNNRLIMLRGFAQRSTKIPKIQWHMGAVSHVMQGKSMAQVVRRELTKIYRKK